MHRALSRIVRSNHGCTGLCGPRLSTITAPKENMRFYLIVSIFLANAAVPVNVKYNGQTWETKVACEAFVASDAGKVSLKTLADAVEASPAGGPGAKLVPVCTDDLKPYQQ